MFKKRERENEIVKEKRRKHKILYAILFVIGFILLNVIMSLMTDF